MYELIVECFFDGSVTLLSSMENDRGVLGLSVEVHTQSFPASLFILAEPRDKHGTRPSADEVVSRGTHFTIESSRVADLIVRINVWL